MTTMTKGGAGGNLNINKDSKNQKAVQSPASVDRTANELNLVEFLPVYQESKDTNYCSVTYLF